VIEDFMKQNGLENLFYIYQNDASFGILPNFLNKKFAVEYILNRDKPSLVLSAGDNISDLDFMKLAHFSILPKGSSLENKL
jgi:trehalose-6-phosphatase